MDYFCPIKKFINHIIMGNKKKNYEGCSLAENEMREIKGGNSFTSSEPIAICPVCGELATCRPYSYTIWCLNCGTEITLEEKNEE